jgi:uncharacterized protein (TIGR04255 family)
MTPTEGSPFSDEAVAETPLLRAPLARVLAQVRWPRTTVISDNLDAVARKFGAAVASSYPLSGSRQEMTILVSPEGVTQQPGATVHQFTSADDDWTVSLSGTFIVLESRKYTSRTDFCERLKLSLDALKSIVAIPVSDRVGFRYINRLHSPEDMDDLAQLVRAEVMGGATIPLANAAELLHCISESLYSLDDVRLMARWAQLPPGGAIDPMIPPVDLRSWLLYLDASREARLPFDPAALADAASRLSTVAHRFFRWSVKPAFLERFGAGT